MATAKARHIFLGFPISVDSPNPPAIPAVKITPLYQLAKGDKANVFLLTLANHTGTHVDAPAHVVEGGLKISEFEPQEFLFTDPVVIELHVGDGEIVQPTHLYAHMEKAKNGDILLCRFRYGSVRRNEPARYKTKCPGFGIASGEFLMKNLPNLRAIGMDVPSLACIEHLNETMAVHNILLGGNARRFLVIEDMNLEHDLGTLKEVFVVPWLIAGIDSAPCTVIGRLAS